MPSSLESLEAAIDTFAISELNDFKKSIDGSGKLADLVADNGVGIGAEISQADFEKVVKALNETIAFAVAHIKKIKNETKDDGLTRVALQFDREKIKDALSVLLDDFAMLPNGRGDIEKIPIRGMGLYRYIEARLELVIALENADKDLAKDIFQQMQMIPSARTVEALQEDIKKIKDDNPDLKVDKPSKPYVSPEEAELLLNLSEGHFSVFRENTLAVLYDRVAAYEGSSPVKISEGNFKALKLVYENLEKMITQFEELGEMELTVGFDTIPISRAKELAAQIKEIIDLQESDNAALTQELEAYKRAVRNYTHVGSQGITLGEFLDSMESRVIGATPDFEAELQEANTLLEQARSVVGTGYRNITDDATQALFEEQFKAQRNWLSVETGRIQGVRDQLAKRKNKLAVFADIEAPLTPHPQEWDAYFKKLYEKDRAAFILFVENYCFKLEAEDEAYTDRDKFKTSEEGFEYMRLRSFLESLEKNDDPGYKGELAELHSYLRIRIEYISLMGPHGDSAMGAAEFSPIAHLFPEFGSAEMHWLRRKWRYAEEMRRVMDIIDEIMVEDTKGTAKALANGDFNHPVFDSVPKGDHSFVKGAWMNNQRAGGKGHHVSITERLLADALDPGAPADERWTVPGKTYKPEALRAIIRLAYCTYLFTKGRPERFASGFSYAGGGSPPTFFELAETIDLYPLAKEMNLSAKDLLEMPEVVTGLKIDRRWLAKMAKARGVFKYIQDNAALHPGIDISIGSLTNEQINDPSKLSEEQIEKFMLQIANDEGESQNDGFTRFRVLMRSIILSEVKADWYGLKHTRHMHLVNKKGEHDEHGDYMAPLVTTPLQIIAGGMSDHFHQAGTRFDSIYEKTAEEVKKFHEKVYHTEPPKLLGGIGNHQKDIEALWKDYANCLGSTSAMRTGEDLVNWQDVGEALAYRLRVLFAVYRETYPKDDPKTVYDKDALGDQRDPKIRLSMAGRFIDGILNSGQTLAGVKTFTAHGREPVLFDHPYDHSKHDLTMKQYLIAFIETDNVPASRSRHIYNTIFAGSQRGRRNAASMVVSWGGIKLNGYEDYIALRKKWGVQEETLNNVFMPGGDKHGQAVEKQKKETADATAKKGGH